MITHRYSPLCPKGYKQSVQDARNIWRTGLFWELGEKGLSFENGCSKIFIRKYVLAEHNPKAAMAVAAFFVFRGDMSVNHVYLLS